MAEKFWKLVDTGDVKALKEGFFMDSMEVGIEVNEIKITSHILHQIWMHIQGSKHHKYLKIDMIGRMPHGRASNGKE
jgi:hypothetical protein